MGGKGPQIIQPTPPPAPPTYQQTLQDYVKAIPDLLAAEQRYGPQFAQSQLDLIKQFGIPTSQALLDIDRSLFPQTAQLQEAVAGQALQGLSSRLPDIVAQQYISDFNAGLGRNVNAPIGVSTRNIGLYNLQEDWKRYYQNLALTTAGRQPLQTAQAPQFGSATAGFGNALNFAAQNYGAYAPAFANQNVLAVPRRGGFSGGGALAGAGTGALLGTFLFPGVGTAIGAGLGGALGGFA